MNANAPETQTIRALTALPGPSGPPLIGNALQIDLTRLHAQLESWAAAHGDLYTFRLGPTRCLVVSDPDAARKVFADRPLGFRRFHTMEQVARELDMHGLFSAEGEDWQRQRRLIMPAFKEENLARAFPVLRTISERLVRLFEREASKGEPIDVLHHLMRFTVDVMAAVAFGRDMNTLERGPDELQRHFEVIFPMLLRRVNAPFPYWRYVKLPVDRALDRALEGAKQILLPVIEQARAERAERADCTASLTLLHAMLDATDEQTAGAAARLSQSEIIANVFTLLLAGEDTTANTLAWIIYFLASHGDVQEQVAEEARDVLGDAAALASMADVSRLRLLTAVTHETLRLKSPAPFVSLEAVTDSVVAGVRVPAGTPVFVLTRRIAMREAYFAQPEEFLPGRWLGNREGEDPRDKREDKREDKHADKRDKLRMSLPFGAGPRVCPGRQLALLECALSLSAVAARFRLSLPPDLVVGERFDFAMEPEGLRVLVSLRG
jgi:cytochrome P450